jgi:hypothetical protein
VDDERSHYLDDHDHRRDFVRAACLMAALTRHVEATESTWLLRTVEMLARRLPGDGN